MTGTQLPALMPGAEPLFFPGGSPGLLLLHGFMASPGEVAWLAEYLAGRGYTVYAPRLPGHGFDPAAMRRVRWQDWYAGALDAYHLLRRGCERVVVIGHSMGGLLATLLASEHPVAALVVAAAPYTRPSWLMLAVPFLTPVLPYTVHGPGDELDVYVRAEQARRGQPQIGRVHYRRWATRAVGELDTLVRQSHDALPRVSAPALLLYAANDPTARIHNSALAAGRLGSAIKEQVTLGRGGHILFQDVAHEEACAAVADFVERQAGPAA